MKKFLKRVLPGHEAVRDNRWLKPFSGSLLHPDLWHITRRSAAGAVAVGLACGLIPGPFQMLGAALLALALRINLPLALFVTLYTNPFTIVPIYLVAFELGRTVLGESHANFVMPPELIWPEFGSWFSAVADWAIGLGKPLGIGLWLLANILAGIGWASVYFLWRLRLVRAWSARRHRRRQAAEKVDDQTNSH